MKTLPCLCGKPIQVDDDDYEKLKVHNWRCSRGRIFQQGFRNNTRRTLTYTILDVPSHLFVDHKNRDFHDNQRENLRFATKAENARNTGTYSNNTSGYKGVCFSVTAQRWVVKLKVDGKDITKGGFLTKEQAALHYNKLAKQYHGEFAFQNEVPA